MEEETRSLRVTELPPDVTTDQLKFLFKNQWSQGGGPVENITLDEATRSAIVVFEESEAVKIIIKRGNSVNIGKSSVRVEPYYENRGATVDSGASNTNMKAFKKQEKSIASNKIILPATDSDTSEEFYDTFSEHQTSQQHMSYSKTTSKPVQITPNIGKQAEKNIKKPSDCFNKPQHNKISENDKTKTRLGNEDNELAEQLFSETTNLSKMAETTVRISLTDVTKPKEFYISLLESKRGYFGPYCKNLMILDGMRRFLYITFNNIQDAKKFCEKKYDSANIFVSTAMASASDLDVYGNLIAIHASRPITEINKLKQHLKKVSGFEVIKTYQYNEERSIIIEFSAEKCLKENIPAMTWKCAGDFMDQYLICAPVQKTRMILVEGIEKISDETLKRYINNSRSGGCSGMVESWERKNMNSSIITLRSVEATYSITNKSEHTLENKILKVTHYFPCLSKEFYQEHFEVTIKDSTKNSQTQQEAALYKKGDRKQLASNYSSKRGASVKVDSDSSNEYTNESDTSSDDSIKPALQNLNVESDSDDEEGIGFKTSFMISEKLNRSKNQSSLNEKIFKNKVDFSDDSDDDSDQNQQLEEDGTESDDVDFSDSDSSDESETDKKQIVKPLKVTKERQTSDSSDDTEIVEVEDKDKQIALLKQQITEQKNIIEQLSEKIKQLEESKIFKVRQEMQEHEYEMLAHYFGKQGSVSVNFNKIKKLATLKGQESEVNTLLCKLLTELNQLEKAELKLSTAMVSILSKEKGKAFIKNFIDSIAKKSRVTFTMDQSNIYLASKDDKMLNEVKGQLQRKLNYKDTAVSSTELSLEKLFMLKYNLENELLICLSWKEDLKEIYAEGVEDDVISSKRDINELIGSHLIHEKVYTMNDLVAQFTQKHLQPKVTSIVSKVECETKDYKTYTFKGDNNSVRIVYGAFRDIVENIVTQTWDLRKVYLNSDMDLWLLFKGLNEEMVKEKIDQIEIKEKCLIRINLPVANTFTRNVDNATAKANSTSTKAIKNIGQLNIKIGNIVEDSSDILVCVLDNHIKLSRTGIGKAFLKACPALKDKLETAKQQNPKSTVITTMGPFTAGLTCKAVCSIVVTRWDKSHSKHELKEWVNTIMKKAMEIGAKSISFPPIGCGQAFKFPLEKLGKTMLKSAYKFFSSNPGAPRINIVVSCKDDAQVLIKMNEHYVKSAESVSIKKGDNNDYEHVHSVQLVSGVKFELSITAEKETNKSVIFAKLSEYFNNQCLHTAEVKDNTLPVWPSTLQKRIEEKAENSSVHVSFSSDENEIKCCLKGFKQNVEVLEKFAMNEIHEVVKNFPRKSIKASNTPPRGSIEFIKYASKINETCPTYWKVYSDKRYWKNVVDRNEERPASGQSKTFLIPVDAKTKKAVIDLVQKTWEPNLVGTGADAKGLVPNTTIEVLDVQRVENIHLFDPYANERKKLFQKMVENEKVCDDFGITLPSKQLKTTEFLESFMKEELYSEINEHYLFHGTKPEFVATLTKQGLDPKLCTHGMLGKGVYLAEKSTKSDQYADPKPKAANQPRSAPGTKLYLFLLRAVLGNTYVVHRDHPRVVRGAERFARPPCMECQDEKCSKDHVFYDSITLDGGGSTVSLYREFVVYSERCCYPEYLITYKRVPPK
ncbi:uncharacterized protein LOC131934836 [Physella acuta]|uniref:uncharacterized protein LOC131934836 n=1 Tax=Physella acuta TaxID=109671 RepID=UPI0027DE9ACC|nr:uncharacterized protein LOC131934836 [Physella acuta]